MRLFIFKSDVNVDLRAFTGDLAGASLPEKYRPWHAVGAIAPNVDPPHRFSRTEIEKAIEHHGFQLWRMKPKVKAAEADSDASASSS